MNVRDEYGHIRDLEEVLRERKAVVASLWGIARCDHRIRVGRSSLPNGARCSMQVGHLGPCLALFDDQPTELLRDARERSKPKFAAVRANEAGQSHHVRHPGAWMGGAVKVMLPDGFDSDDWATA